MDNDSNKQISRTQCNNCKGTGFIKLKTIICSNCNGSTCGVCNNKGYIQPPWGLCENCNGDGEFVDYKTF